MFLDIITPLSMLGTSLFPFNASIQIHNCPTSVHDICASNHGFRVFSHMLIVSIAVITVCVSFLTLGMPLPASLVCVAAPCVLCSFTNPHVSWPTTRPQRRRQWPSDSDKASAPMTMAQRQRQSLSEDRHPQHQSLGPNVDKCHWRFRRGNWAQSPRERWSYVQKGIPTVTSHLRLAWCLQNQYRKLGGSHRAWESSIGTLSRRSSRSI